MPFDLELFKKALDNNNIQYRETGVSLAVSYCPECGNSGFKVLFRVKGVSDNQPYFGRCQRGSCQQNYSSVTYFLKNGLSYQDVMSIHGLNYTENIEKIKNISNIDYVKNIIDNTIVDNEIKKKEVILDISNLKDIDKNKYHIVSKYAYKRGYIGNFNETIKADLETGAVVFIIRNEKNKPIGTQHRYLYPTNPNMKTKTSKGFSKSKHILQFPRAGSDVLVCEGPFTALSAWHYGFHGVCTFGSMVSKEQLNMISEIVKNNKVNIAVACEKDKAGEEYLSKIMKYFYWDSIKPYKILPETGNDLNDSWQNKTGIIRENIDSFNPAIPKMVFL